MCSMLSWRERKRRLWDLLSLKSPKENDEGYAVDMHALQEATNDQDAMSNFNQMRFTNRDLSNFGALAHGPFGSVCMVRCKLDNQLYVRKSVEKRVVARNPSQCYPHHEKEILRAASILDSPWAPHLLCTFQSQTKLYYIMDFAEGGSLGDLLETSGQISEIDLKWWLPQMVVAIHWCHSQGFCHRDIKPANFVVTSTGHLLLIDFASSARLLPPDVDGVQLVPKEACLALCGTCDYISPEILSMQEDALVALDNQKEIHAASESGGYGRETDWWSLGATIYELVYGVAPFFAKDIRRTYDLIVNHEKTLRFPGATISTGCVSFIAGLLKSPAQRLGRKHVDQIKTHSFVAEVSWSRLHSAVKPPGLQLPRFEYDLPIHSIQEDDEEESFSKGYAFSVFFNSSVSASSIDSNATNPKSSRRPFLPSPVPEGGHPVPSHLEQYIGFTWGPRMDAFDRPLKSPITPPQLPMFETPVQASKQPTTSLPSLPSIQSGPLSAPPQTTAPRPLSGLVTPIRPSSMQGPNHHPPSTVRRTAGGTARKAGTTRAVSEIEALRQMGDCVRASARKRLSQHAAGETPGPAGSSGGAMSSGVRRRANWVRKALNLENVEGVHSSDDERQEYTNPRGVVLSLPGGQELEGDRNRRSEDGGLRIFVNDTATRPAVSHVRQKSGFNSFRGGKMASGGAEDEYDDQSTGGILFGTAMRGNVDITTTDDAPPSPSPSPRPMSAMSRPTSSLSRRGFEPIQPPPSTGPTTTQAGGFSGVSFNTSVASTKGQKPISFRSASKSGSSLGIIHSAPSSTKVPPTEPVSIFKPPPPNSRSRSGSAIALKGTNEPNAMLGREGRVPSRDVDDDEGTPKAKPLLSDSRPIFIPPGPIFERRPPPLNKAAKESHPEGDRRDVDRRTDEPAAEAPPPNSTGPDIPLDRETPVQAKQLRTGSDVTFAEMEERLRVMMSDIERVEAGVVVVRAKMEL